MLLIAVDADNHKEEELELCVIEQSINWHKLVMVGIENNKQQALRSMMLRRKQQCIHRLLKLR